MKNETTTLTNGETNKALYGSAGNLDCGAMMGTTSNPLLMQTV